MVAPPRPERNHGANRLFNQLHLRITDRRLSTSANSADRAQPALLRPINRGLWFCKGEGLVRMVVRTEQRSDLAIATAGRRARSKNVGENSSDQSPSPR